MSRPPGRRRLFEFLAAILRQDNQDPPLPWHTPELWRALMPIADFHQVVPALPRALRALSVWEKLPSDVAELLAALHKLNLERNKALKAQGLEILATLDRAGISAVPLKGFAYQLIGLYADDPGQRQMIDIDILASKDDARTAQDILIAAGYSPISDDVVDEKIRHHFQPLIPDPETRGPGAVEVHFRLGRAEYADLLPVKTIMAASVKVKVDGRNITVPKYSDLLDHAVMHGGVQENLANWRTLRLRDTLDIGRLWSMARSEGSDISDLRLTGHRAASKHFGACLLLNGSPPQELGPLEHPAKRHLVQLLRRQSIAERPALERAIAGNVRLMRTNPRMLASKILRGRFYRNIIAALTSRRT